MANTKGKKDKKIATNSKPLVAYDPKNREVKLTPVNGKFRVEKAGVNSPFEQDYKSFTDAQKAFDLLVEDTTN